MRIKVMPGARMLMIVTMKLIAPKIDEKPMRMRAMAQTVWPEPVCSLSGG